MSTEHTPANQEPSHAPRKERPPEVGQPFNPWRGACGFYPPDIIGQARSLQTRAGESGELTDGRKRLYERLVRFAGRDGRCFPSQAVLAAALAKSQRQIRRDIHALERFGLIAIDRGEGRGHSSRYVFLWHSVFSGHPSTSTLCNHGPEPEETRTPGSAFDNDETRTPVSPFGEETRTAESAFVAGEKRTSMTIKADRYDQKSGHRCPPNYIQELSTPIKRNSRAREGSLMNHDWPATADAGRLPSAMDGFREFQRRYPETKRGVKIESACRAYVSRIHGKPNEHEQLLAGLSRYVASAKWQQALADDPSGRFIPMMERFIAEGLYLDHPPGVPEEPDDGYVGYEEAKRREQAELLREEVTCA
jgi:hypothetical protein